MARFDDIVIGSGLAALGTVLGLLTRPGRRVLVLAGAADGGFAHYDATRAVPAAFRGPGGLGSHWHGVIPLSLKQPVQGQDLASFGPMLARFYPRFASQDWLGKPVLFVPWKPIRPHTALQALCADHPERLRMLARRVDRIEAGGSTHTAHAGQDSWQADRLWVAAGAMDTPFLLARSFGPGFARTHASDHVLCYVGHVDQVDAPRTHRTPEGVLFPAFHDAQTSALYTLRPARFGFRQLDQGIEQRAAFGLPTGSAVSKIARSMSAGLLAEAFYNRFGLFASASRYSIYAQTPVSDGYALQEGELPLRPDRALIEATTTMARTRQPFAGATISRRPDLFIPGIHLHASVNLGALQGAGMNRPGDAIQVVDAAGLPGIGAEHHSFKMLCAAFQRAQQA